MEIPVNQVNLLHDLLLADEQLVSSQDTDDAARITRKLMEKYKEILRNSNT
jgi:hypothetical protein